MVKIAQNYNTAGGKTFPDGDFNYDGTVDFNELVLLAQRHNTTLAVAAAATPVAGAAMAASMEMASQVMPSKTRAVQPVFSTVPVVKAVARPVPKPKTPVRAVRR